MQSTTSASLQQTGVVITRPKHQAQAFWKKVKKVGGCPFLFPLIEITPLIEQHHVIDQLKRLNEYDVVIFVSTNAVEISLALIDRATLQNQRIAVTGKKTRDVLTQRGITVDFCPERFFNSEALLAMEGFIPALKDKNVAIIRGKQGRTHLQESLDQIAHTVDFIDVYQRDCPQHNLNALQTLHRQHKLLAILLTSSTSVANLFRLACPADFLWLNQSHLIIGSQRMQQAIPTTFRGKLSIAENPSDETLLERLVLDYG